PPPPSFEAVGGFALTSSGQPASCAQNKKELAMNVVGSIGKWFSPGCKRTSGAKSFVRSPVMMSVSLLTPLVPVSSIARTVIVYVPVAAYECGGAIPDPDCPSPKSQEYVSGAPSGSKLPVA